MKLSEVMKEAEKVAPTGAPKSSGRRLKLSDVMRDPRAPQHTEPKKMTRSERRRQQREARKPKEVNIFRGLPKATIDKIKEKSRVYTDARGRTLDRPKLNRQDLIRYANLERLRQKHPYLADEIENTSSMRALAIGAGEGMTSLARGVGLVDEKSEQQKIADQALREFKPIAGVGKTAAQAAPFLVPGAAIGNIASAPARIALAGGLGAAEGNIIARGEGKTSDEIMAATGMGLLLGSVGEAALPLVTKMARSLARRANAPEQLVDRVNVNPDGTPTPELQQVLDSHGMSIDDLATGAARGFDDPVMNAERQRAFDDLGLGLTEAERTRRKDLWNLQQDAKRTETPVSHFVERREEQLDTLTQQKIAETQGIPQRASDTTYNAVLDKSNQLADDIDGLYAYARQQAPEEKVVRFDQAIKSLIENAPSNEMSGGVVKALRDKMRSMGVVDKKWKTSGRVDLETSEELRKYANRLSKTANPEGQYIIKQFKNGLDDDVFKSMDDVSPEAVDYFKNARKAKADFEQSLDPSKESRFDKRKISLVRDILDNRVKKDDLAPKILTRSSKYEASDLEELKKYLTTGTEEQIAKGQSAWNDIRSSALQQIKDESFVGPMTDMGTQTLSRARLDSALKKIGPKKLAVLFSPKELEFIKKLSRVAVLKEPPPGTFTGSGPTSPAVQELQNELRRRVPIFGDIFNAWVLKRKEALNHKLVMELQDDVAKIEEQNARRAMQDFRKSRAGITVPAPAAITIAETAGAEEEQ